MPKGLNPLNSDTSESKLLETTLAATVPREQVKKITSELINRFQSFAGAIAAHPCELIEVEGLGDAGVAALKTMHSAALGLTRARIMGKPVIENWPCVVDYLLAAFSGEKNEQMRVLYLDEAYSVKDEEAHSAGSVNFVMIDARKIFSRTLKVNAKSVVLAHNHPSGDPTPSLIDIELTRSMKISLASISVILLDHVVIGNGRWVSFRNKRLL